jgi:hypothetical protein
MTDPSADAFLPTITTVQCSLSHDPSLHCASARWWEDGWAENRAAMTATAANIQRLRGVFMILSSS